MHGIRRPLRSQYIVVIILFIKISQKFTDYLARRESHDSKTFYFLFTYFSDACVVGGYGCKYESEPKRMHELGVWKF